MATESFDQAVSRLAQYRPFAHEGRDQRGALRDLILGAAAEAGGAFAHLGECLDAVKTLWRLEIELDELRAIVDDLVETGACVRENGGFRLTDGQHAQLERQAAASRENEKNAFAEWEATVRGISPDLTEENFTELGDDLHTWIQRVISRHGVEAALILYPENPRARTLYAEIEALGLTFLPERTAAFRRVRERAIQAFVQQPTAEQRTYLSNLLNVSYFLTVLSLDPQASHLVQEQVSGHRVYLDTNVLYRTLGLSKMNEVLSARRLLELTKELGFEVVITSWTLNEMKRSLQRARQQVKARALPPREWAHLMAEATTQEGFIKAYWIQYKEKGVTPDDFFAFYSALERILEEDGITVNDEGTGKVRDSDVEAQLPVLSSVILWERPDVVMRHDIKHRLLIEQLRGTGNLTFANARYWFLTQDSALPRYAEIGPDGEDLGVPFCSSTSAWAQVVRSLVPRTEDLDQALVDLLASPYMRYRGGVSAQAVQEIVARIDQFEGVSAPMASEVLLNGAVVRDIARTDDPVARQEKIDNALIKSAEQLHSQVEILSERDAEQRNALRLVEAERLSSQAEVEHAHARIEELEQQLEARRASERDLSGRLSEAELSRREAEERAEERARIDRETHEVALTNEQQDRAELTSRVEATETRLRNQEAQRIKRARVVRWTGAALLWVAAITVTVLLLALGAVKEVWPIVGVLLGGLLLVCSGIWLIWGGKRAWQVFLVLGAVIGVVAAVQQIVDSSVDDTPAASQSRP